MRIDESPPLWRDRLIAEINGADARAIALANALTPEQLNWKPRPEQWSIGQCLEHLWNTNEVYCPAMVSALNGRPHGVAQELIPGWLGRWFIRNFIEPSPVTKRGKSPKKIKPAAYVDPTILDRFLVSNQTARELVDRAAGYDVNRIRFRNPFIPLIHFTVGTGLEILSQHQRRHLLQAERIKTLADGTLDTRETSA